jgi:hypothetical protein
MHIRLMAPRPPRDLPIDWRWFLVGSMLMHADNGGVDHLDSGIVGSGKRVYDAAPDTSPPPATAEQDNQIARVMMV